MRWSFIFLSIIVFKSVFGQLETLQINNSIQDYANKMILKESLVQAPFSFYVKDLNSDTIIAKINGQMCLPSASTMKLVSTATALELLGKDYKFKTLIAYSGSINKATKTLNGNLYLIGGGDPTINSKYFSSTTSIDTLFKNWVKIISSLGIQSINGKVVANGSRYAYNGVPSGWIWGDIGNYYGAGPNGLTFSDNLIQLNFKSNAIGRETDITCINPHIPNLEIQNNVIGAKSRRDNAYVYGGPYSLNWFVNGSIPANRDEFIVKAANPDPELSFAFAFDYALNQQFITTKYTPTTNRQLLFSNDTINQKLNIIHTHYSPTLIEIVRLTNQKSINLFAEHLLCELSTIRTGLGTTSNGAQICEAFWKTKTEGTGLIMSDGSGLSRSNSVSSKFLVDLLTYMSSSNEFKSSLSIAGKKGTLVTIGQNTAAEGRVIGKSGTMSKIKSYAGYVSTKTGKELAFSMIINNYDCPTSTIKKHFEQLMILMAEY